MHVHCRMTQTWRAPSRLNYVCCSGRQPIDRWSDCRPSFRWFSRTVRSLRRRVLEKSDCTSDPWVTRRDEASENLAPEPQTQRIVCDPHTLAASTRVGCVTFSLTLATNPGPHRLAHKSPKLDQWRATIRQLAGAERELHRHSETS